MAFRFALLTTGGKWNHETTSLEGRSSWKNPTPGHDAHWETRRGKELEVFDMSESSKKIAYVEKKTWELDGSRGLKVKQFNNSCVVWTNGIGFRKKERMDATGNTRNFGSLYDKNLRKIKLRSWRLTITFWIFDIQTPPDEDFFGPGKTYRKKKHLHLEVFGMSN